MKTYKIRLISFIIDIAFFTLLGYNELGHWSMKYGIFIRVLFMFTMLIGFGFSMEVFVKSKVRGLAVTYIVTYVSGVLVVCLLSAKSLSILEKVIWLHSEWKFFSFLGLPFLTASTVAIFLMFSSSPNRVKSYR